MGNRRLLLQLLLLVFLFSACNKKRKNLVLNNASDYAKAESFLETNSDSAYFYFNKVANESKDSLEAATAYSYMSTIQSDAGDYYGSQESLLNSLKLLREQREIDHNCLLADYNELGNTSQYLENYDAALHYYDQALKYIKDDDFRCITLNNKALIYQKKKQYEDALSFLESIIDKTPKGTKEYARILSNIATTKWLRDSNYNASIDLKTSLHIRDSLQDLWGINAAYSHLADYYMSINKDSAINYANKMYRAAQQLKSPSNLLEALENLIELSSEKEAKFYFKKYISLRDSLYSTRNNAKNQFAMIRYDAEKNKADNLQLQKDNQVKKNQIILQWTILIVILLLSGVIYFWYQKRQQKEIFQQRMRTSQRVHDVVANSVYRLMSEIEHRELMNKELLLDKLEEVYNKSRDLSYEIKELPTFDFSIKIKTLLQSFSSPDITVSIVGNDANLWSVVKESTQKEIEIILQELMINMKKHSKAKNVVLKLEQKEKAIQIEYVDDGIGMTKQIELGNGLKNTETRIKKMKGILNFDHSLVIGLKIIILIPTV